MLIILTNILSFKRVKINVYKKIDYLLYDLKSAFICSIFRSKIYLDIANNLPKNIDYFGIFVFEIIIIYNKFIFNLNFFIFENYIFFV